MDYLWLEVVHRRLEGQEGVRVSLDQGRSRLERTNKSVSLLAKLCYPVTHQYYPFQLVPSTPAGFPSLPPLSSKPLVQLQRSQHSLQGPSTRQRLAEGTA